MSSQQSQAFRIAVFELLAHAFSKADGQIFNTDRCPPLFAVEGELLAVEKRAQTGVVKL